MQDEVIKRALEVAAEELPRFNDMYEGTPEQAAAAAIAAFLRTMRDPGEGGHFEFDDDCFWTDEFDMLALAVERAAGGGA